MQGVIFTADLSTIQKESREIIDILRIENGVCKGLLDNAFRNGEVLTNITIPDSATSIGDNAFRGCTGLTSVTLGKHVSSIGDNAFEGCTGLTSIAFSDSVTSIGCRAFRDCTGLKNVYIGNSVTSIGDNAFRDCTDLTIYGTRGSYAETYAKENNIQYFVSDI